MHLPSILRLLLSPLPSIVRVIEFPARAVTRWSDDADEVWEPFLEDEPLHEAPLAAA